MANFKERFSALVQVEPVFLVAAVRPTRTSRPTEFFHEVNRSGNVVDCLVHKDVVEPELRLVIPDRLLALQAVGDIDVWKAVIVEIKRAAAPRPAGTGDGIIQGSFVTLCPLQTSSLSPIAHREGGGGGRGPSTLLFEAAVYPSKKKTISKGHRRSSQAILSRVEAPQAQMFQAVHSWRGHSDHQQVEPAIRIEIRQRVRHAESVRLGDRLAGHVGEVAAAVILVKVKAGKITHKHQVKVAVVVEVRQRRAVNATPAFWAQAGRVGHINEVCVAIVLQQVGGQAVIRVIVIGPQNLAEGGHPVLTEEYIQIAIVVE